ncbi:MAG: universal stress protein [Acidobacteriota bacterium]|nr:universal stress protein [Acidobacteriota bacterium]
MKILLPVDGSEYSKAAVHELLSRPWPADTQVEVLSVAHPTPEYLDPRMVASAIHVESLEREMKRARQNVDEAAGAIRQGAALLDVSTKILEGSPKEAILREAAAWGADLIMLGSHGYGFAMRFLLGSVSHAVALHAPCSVEIVRSRTAEAGPKS